MWAGPGQHIFSSWAFLVLLPPALSARLVFGAHVGSFSELSNSPTGKPGLFLTGLGEMKARKRHKEMD